MKLKFSIEWLFVFIPVTLALEHLGVAAPLLFFSAALAIVPIASLIVHATEQLATRTGDAIGGLFNNSPHIHSARMNPGFTLNPLRRGHDHEQSHRRRRRHPGPA